MYPLQEGLKGHSNSDGHGFVIAARSSAKLIIFLIEFEHDTGWSASLVVTRYALRVTLRPESVTVSTTSRFDFGGE
jgi:hypothetical protein